MPRSRLTNVVHHLSRLLGTAAPAALADAELVERFVRHRDEAAFAALVERHGPLVLGVCRQVLHEENAAEDAFQATFLVLARKAGSLRTGQALGSWLYRVALNLARTARTAAARRQAHERQAPAMPPLDPLDEAALRELRPVLHEEVGRLPEKYRLPVLLCHLEGRTHEQAAAALGWPVGTVRSRLSRARDLLRRRLERRGVTAVSAALAALLGRQATAAVPTALASLTVRSALPFAARQALPAGAASTTVLTLAEEALRAMTTNKLRWLLVCLLVLGITGTGAGVLIGQHGLGGEQAPARAGQEPAPEAPPKPGAAGQPLPGPAAGLPPGAISQLGGGNLRHAGTVETYTFAPDGKTLVTASSDDGALRLWDTATGQQRARLSLPPEARLVRQMTFSPDGKVLAITGLEQVIRLWDAGTGKPLRVLRWPAEQGDSPVLAFSPDGKKLASWTNDFTVRLWDVGIGREVGSFVPAPDKAVRQLAFGPDDTTLLMVFDDGKAQLWDSATGKKRQEFHNPGLLHWCHAAAVSPDGKTVATGGLNDVCLWETATGRLRRRLTGYKRPVLALAFSPDGLSLSTASDGGECRVWRVADGRELHRVQLPVQAAEANPVRKLLFSRDGATLAWNHWRQHEWVHLTDVKTGKQVETLGQPAAALAAFAPDGKTVATPTEDGRLRLWETATGKEVRTFAGAPGKVEWLGFTADGKTLLSVGKEVIFWDAGTGKEVRRRAAPQVTFDRRACALLPGDRILAVGEANYSRWSQRGCRVFLWDLEAGRELRRFGGSGEGLNPFDSAHALSVTSVAVSADGKLLASAGRDKIVRLWDVGTGKELRRWGVELNGHSNAVAFADGGKSLVAASAYFKAGSDAFRLMRWELVTGKERDRWEGFSPGVVNIPALFSPDGRTLACAHRVDGLDLFQAHHGKVRLRLRTNPLEFSMPIAFSPDGRLLASWHGNSTVLIWDVSQR